MYQRIWTPTVGGVIRHSTTNLPYLIASNTESLEKKMFVIVCIGLVTSGGQLKCRLGTCLDPSSLMALRLETVYKAFKLKITYKTSQ